MSYIYRVEIIKREIFEVAALSAQEAEDIALERCDADPFAWEGPADEIHTERIIRDPKTNCEVER